MKAIDVYAPIESFAPWEEKSLYTVNFGPQHPASHGVLRLAVVLKGELVYDIEPQIGFLHRGSEKLMEFQPFSINSVYMDRLDYTSVLTQTHAYCLTIESITGNGYKDTSTAIARTIFDELARILNHLLAISTHSLDVGSMSTLFWAFEDRERIMEILEYVSGARMHAALYIPNETLGHLLTFEFLYKILIFLRNCQKSFSEMFIVLYNNRVWKLRLAHVGELDGETAILNGVTGPILKASGGYFDNRCNEIESYAY